MLPSHPRVPHAVRIGRNPAKEEQGHIMKDLEDIELKSEMDEIMRSVESIMKKIEAVLPVKPEAPDRVEE
jgi:hypothetical protein